MRMARAASVIGAAFRHRHLREREGETQLPMQKRVKGISVGLFQMTIRLQDAPSEVHAAPRGQGLDIDPSAPH
jgi:hypothetical protein